MYDDTIAAVATPPGRGGIAVIRISGGDAIAIADKIFRPKQANKSLEKCPGYSALFGEFHEGDKMIDEGIVLCFRAPHSYTGEDVVELNCHGSEAVCRELLHACYTAGAAPAQPGEYTKRAYLNGRISLTQAEAVMDLISAQTMRGAQMAQTVLKGKLQEKIQTCKDELIELLGHIAAWIDYPEEDVNAVKKEKIGKTVQNVKNRLEEMIQKYERGAVIRRGVRAVIVGSPNVGKSTLFNLLAGTDRSIVTEIAGTTRDVVREEVNIGDTSIYIADTAGIRQQAETIEQIGIEKSYEEIERAELVIAVFDGSTKQSEKDLEIVRLCREKTAVAIINKNDLENKFDAGMIEEIFKKVVYISAKNDTARDLVEEVVLEAIDAGGIDPNEPILSNERQLYAAKEALIALKDIESAHKREIYLDAQAMALEDALDALSKLTGESSSDAIIEEVFSKFCVGK